MRDLAEKFDLQYVSAPSNVRRNSTYFRNKTTGVEFQYDPRDIRVNVIIGRLNDEGLLSPFPSPVTPNSNINSFGLYYILKLRSPGDIELVGPPLPYKEQISVQVALLDKYSADILEGDFSIFPTLEQMVKERARQDAISRFGDRAKDFGWT